MSALQKKMKNLGPRLVRNICKAFLMKSLWTDYINSEIKTKQEAKDLYNISPEKTYK